MIPEHRASSAGPDHEQREQRSMSSRSTNTTPCAYLHRGHMSSARHSLASMHAGQTFVSTSARNCTEHMTHRGGRSSRSRITRAAHEHTSQAHCESCVTRIRAAWLRRRLEGGGMICLHSQNARRMDVAHGSSPSLLRSAPPAAKQRDLGRAVFYAQTTANVETAVGLAYGFGRSRTR